MASCSDGRVLEELDAISRTLVVAGFIAVTPNISTLTVLKRINWNTVVSPKIAIQQVVFLPV